MSGSTSCVKNDVEKICPAAETRVAKGNIHRDIWRTPGGLAKETAARISGGRVLTRKQWDIGDLTSKSTWPAGLRKPQEQGAHDTETKVVLHKEKHNMK